jgi:hypothetical protein
MTVTMHSKPNGVYLVNGKCYVTLIIPSFHISSLTFFGVFLWEKGVPTKQTILNLGKKFFLLAWQ